MDTLFPLEIDFEASHGSFLVDKKTGIEYLDFFSMYSSLVLGYNHPVFDASFEQEVVPLTKLRFSTNAFQSEYVRKFYDKFSESVFSNFIHFTCTGALAVESALKSAMEYKKVQEPIVLSLENSFHGVNSWGFASSLVGVTASRLQWMPRLSWPSLDIDLLIDYLQASDLTNIVAVIIEPIQCTNGDIYLDKNKLKIIFSLCRENDICFILDEIQTGFGTTGKMWYYQYMGFEPDIMVFGKKTQVCGIVLSEQYADVLSLSQKKLQVTFDGDVIDILRAYYVLNYINDNDVLFSINQNSRLLKAELSPVTKNYRSIGYLVAFDFDTLIQRDSFVARCLSNHLIINSAGEKTVRMRPNLAVTDSELRQVIRIIKGILC